jgi:prepilin-type N-terminal cleavage/methylation domain-containing protein
MNQKGFTLIELLIYIVLFGFLSVLINRQFNSLVQNYISGQKIARQQTDARDIIGLMLREIKNTGVKVYISNVSGSLIKDTADGAFVSTTDRSSFIHKQGATTDTLIIYKARLTSTGNLEFMDTVAYYINGSSLIRDLKTTDSPHANISTIAENVYALQFQYGISGSNVTLFDQDPITAANWTLNTLSGSAPTKTGTTDITLTFGAAATGNLKYNTKCSVDANSTYSVSLQITPLNDFPKNLDSLRFTFKNGATLLGSESFKPYSSAKLITIQNSNFTGNADMSLEFYAKGSGSLLISGIQSTKVEDSSFTWSSNPAMADKRNVRAIRVFVLTRSEKAGTKSSAPIKLGDITFTPPAGEYTWRLNKETIAVPNNGMF